MNIAKAIINLKHLKDNLAYLRSISNNAEIFPVIKANAYGHGLQEIAKALQNLKVKGVCVATINEIIDLVNLELNYDILHLGKIDYSNIKYYHNHNVIATINSLEDIEKIIKSSKQRNIVRVHIKIDTGMSRMGCNIDEFDKILTKCKESSFIKVEGIYSHLANSNNKKINYNNHQITSFQNAINKIINKNNYKFHL